MLTFISGAPGTGKTAALVSLLAEISKGRTVYVAGIPDLKIDHQPLVDPLKWHESVPDGSVIVIDEVQEYWRPLGPGKPVPDSIAALERHRHRGLDIFIISQGPNLVHSNVRALVGRHVHLRDLGFLGRWWYEWPECADNCRTGWKSAPIKKRYRLPKAIFNQYKSATEHIKPIRSFPYMVIVLALALVGTAGTAYYGYRNVSKSINPDPVKVSASDPLKPGSGAPAPAARPAFEDPNYWIPRTPARPETAPAFDQLRVVTAMPLVSAGYCRKSGCKCYTQQATLVQMTSEECRAFVENTPFNPYVLASAAAAPVQQSPEVAPSVQSSPAPAPSALPPQPLGPAGRKL